MINKHLINYRHFLLAIFISLLSPSVFALSLGEMTVHSHFAEPFRAEISLPSYSPDETSSIDIHIASAAQHKAMGYVFSDTTQQFQFSLKENNKGVLYIDVRSKSAIKELSISILIEVTSVNGRIIKGYDILLTPKAISETWQKDKIEQPFQLKLSKANHNAPQTEAVSLTTTKNKTSATKVSKKQKSKVIHNDDGSVLYPIVRRGESLSFIAQRMRPNKTMHMNQVMIALYNENPKAFLNNNINLLKVGVSLQLNELSSIKNISPFRAGVLINQYGHSSKTHHQPKDNKTKIASQGNKNTTPSKKTPINRLQISNDDEFLTAEILDEFHQEQLANVESELKNAHETIKNLDLQNKSLVERITALENEIGKTAKALFISPSQTELNNDSSTNNDMLVINTQLDNSEKNDSSILAILKDNQLPLSFAAAGLLSIALIATRKKEALIELIHKFKKPRTNTPNYFDLK